VLDLLEHRNPITRIAIIGLFDLPLEFQQLLMKRPEQQGKSRGMLFVELFPLFADDPAGQKLKILFDLLPCLGQERLPFVHLLLHGPAGGLQGGILGVHFAALPGQLVAFQAKTLHLGLLGARLILQPLQPQRQDQMTPLGSAVARKQDENGHHRACTAPKTQKQVNLIEGGGQGGHDKKMGKGTRRSTAPGTASQFVDLIQQIQDQGAARQVDAKIVLQPDRGLYPLNGDKGEPPLPRGIPFRTNDPLLDHAVDAFGADPAQPAQIRQGAAGFFIKDHALDIGSLFGHIQIPSSARGLNGIFCAMVAYSLRCSSVVASGNNYVQGDNLIAAMGCRRKAPCL
jgi:hypothetical protein